MQNITDIIEYKGQILHRTSNGKFFTESPRGGYEYVDGPEEGLKKFAVMGTMQTSFQGASAPGMLQIFNTLDEARAAKQKEPQADGGNSFTWNGFTFPLLSKELWIEEFYQ